MTRRHDQAYRDAHRLLRRHRPDPSGSHCNQARCAGDSWPCEATATAQRLIADYDGSHASSGAVDTAPTWRLTPAAYTVSPTTPLCRDMGNVMELMHRMGTVSIAQLAVRLGRPRLIITLVLRALTTCGWAAHTALAQ